MVSLLLITHITAHSKISLLIPCVNLISFILPIAHPLLLSRYLCLQQHISQFVLFSIVFLYLDPQITQVYSLNLCLPELITHLNPYTLQLCLFCDNVLDKKQKCLHIEQKYQRYRFLLQYGRQRFGPHDLCQLLSFLGNVTTLYGKRKSVAAAKIPNKLTFKQIILDFLGGPNIISESLKIKRRGQRDLKHEKD